jgi:hypothetical protein
MIRRPRGNEEEMSASDDIASARALFEKAEREVDPELKAHALDEALALLGSCDPDNLTKNERALIVNLRLSHTRRLLSQLVPLSGVSMDAWFEYADLLFGELRNEVDELIDSDPRLHENYVSFVNVWGSEVADMLKRHQNLPP